MVDGIKTILVTGGAGYVGSTFIRDALADGYRVRCLDLLVFGGKSIVGFLNHPNFEFIQGDIRDEKTVINSLEGIDYVVHLAAIVGDTPCQAAPRSAYQINFVGTKLLADYSKKVGIKKFVFASTCSNYGISDPNSFAAEESKLNPVSLYAETKIDCERLLMDLNDENFATLSLRFGTAFGVSFRTRFDLTVNSLAFEAWKSNEIVIFKADTWRPYIHVADMSLIILKVLQVDKNKINGQIYNAGSTKQNYMKKEIVEILLKQMPQLQTKYIDNIDDRRNYRVSFEKFESLTKFKPSRTVEDGYRELLLSFRAKAITKNDFEKYNLDAMTEFFNDEKMTSKQND